MRPPIEDLLKNKHPQAARALQRPGRMRGRRGGGDRVPDLGGEDRPPRRPSSCVRAAAAAGITCALQSGEKHDSKGLAPCCGAKPHAPKKD